MKGTLYLANDATTLMLLPPRGGSGVVTIIGTGSVVLAAHNGRARKFSGDEWVVSDVGAGIQLGLRGLREAYGKFQGWNTERETGLDEVMRQWIEVEISKHANPLRLPDDVRSMDLDDQIPYAMRSLATFGSHLKALVAGFAPHVLHESTKLDAGAMKILDETTREMAQLIYMQCEWVRNQDPDRYGKRFTVCLDGYIGGSPPYLNRLQAALNLLGNPERPVQIGFDIIGTARFSAAEHETSPHPDPAALDLMPLGAAPPPSFAMAKMIDAGYDGPLDVSPDMDTMVVPLTGE